MKVWLNELKEGDTFYFPSTILCSVLKCEHLGDAHNMNYKMSRIKYKILDECDDSIKEALGDSNEMFVNQYVYTDYDSAKEELIKKLNKELNTCNSSIDEHKRQIKILGERATELKIILKNIDKNDKCNIKKDI